MSKVALLTIPQYRQLYRYELPNGTILNAIAGESGDFFISEEEIAQCTNITELAWLQDLDLVEYSTLVKPDTTPPTPTGYGVVIPSDYNKLGFWSAKVFKLGGFVVPLTDYNGGLAVDVAYLQWQGFRLEQDKPINRTIFDEFSTLWYELKTKAENNDLVQL